MLQRITCLALALSLAPACNGRYSDPGSGDDNTGVRGKPDGGTPAKCTDLRCKIPNCKGKGTTSISGVVNIPAGNLPLYSATVYVPNGPLAPIPTGPSCDRCDNQLTGDPLVKTSTDVRGQFQLRDVPAGRNIPLVVGLGKWRRQITIPNVTACQDNMLDPADTRLPRNQGEGNIPRIALTTGNADAIECLLRKLGLDDSEFTPEAGPGRVNLFAGNGGTNSYQPMLNGGAQLTPVAGWWSKLDNLKQYDILVLSCEGAQHLEDKSEDARKALQDYINAGGRVFASHWHNAWIQNGPAPINKVASFLDPLAGQAFPSITATIDTSFDKGMVLSEWLVNVGASKVPGMLPILTARSTVASIDTSLSQRYVYYNDPGRMTQDVQYFTFNAPIGEAPERQCGRMVFTDIHVSGNDPSNFNPSLDYSSPGAPFPKGCVTTDLSPQEKALIFLLFDLTSCVGPILG